jgi:microcystin-dependent protein
MDALPVASVIASALTAAPINYVATDGSSYLRTTYPDLFTAIGTTFGSVDGTHFNVPNIKGRVIVGRDPADTDFDVLGDVFGAKTVVLTSATMPSHNHTQNAHNHTLGNAGTHNHSYGNAWTNAPADGGSDINRYHVAVGVNNDHGLGTMNNGDHGHSINNSTPTNNSTGSDGAHNNVQPSFVLNYYIKAVTNTPVVSSGVVELLQQSVTPASPPAGYTRVYPKSDGRLASLTPAGVETVYDPIPIDTGWITPAFVNGWVNYDPTTYSVAKYRKIGNVVYVSGLVKSGTLNTDIFILPVGYRPARNLHFATAQSPGGAGSFGIVEICVIAGTPGAVKANTGGNTWFSIECSFPVP